MWWIPVLTQELLCLQRGCASWSWFTGRLVSWSDRVLTLLNLQSLVWFKGWFTHTAVCCLPWPCATELCCANAHRQHCAPTMPLPYHVAVCLLSRTEIFLDKWIVSQLVKKFLKFLEPIGLSFCSHGPTTCPLPWAILILSLSSILNKIHFTHAAPIILLGVITQIIFGEQCKSWRQSLMQFSPVPCSFFPLVWQYLYRHCTLIHLQSVLALMW